MHRGNLIDDLIASVQSAEQHASAFEGNGLTQQVTRAQAYSEYLYETWFRGQQTGVA